MWSFTGLYPFAILCRWYVLSVAPHVILGSRASMGLFHSFGGRVPITSQSCMLPVSPRCGSGGPATFPERGGDP